MTWVLKNVMYSDSIYYLITDEGHAMRKKCTWSVLFINQSFGHKRYLSRSAPEITLILLN